MSFEIGMQRLLEYQRLVVLAEVTEEGAFAPNETPDDLVSSFTATIEVVYATVHVDVSGRVRLTTYNPPDLLNKTRQKGMPILLPDGRTIRQGVETPNIETQWRINDNLPEEQRNLNEYVWAAFSRELGDWVL